jgi:hypothetical protein
MTKHGFWAGLWAVLIAAAAAGLPSHAAKAQALPGWKITDICAKESAPGQCAAFEGRALKAVSSSWPFVLEPIKQACLAQVKPPYDESWRSLSDCLNAETVKALDKSAVHTRYTPAEPVPPPRPEIPLPPALQIQIPPAPELVAPAAPPKPQ